MDLQSIKNRFGVIGNDPKLNYALTVAEQVANTDLSVLITGESGVGKEVFSKIIHNLSSRKHNSFIAINCGAIPEGTMDSELFGHEKGAFTSANDQRKGYFETVSGGTIFLDEIGEMPIGTQARLLRVLETGEYMRVGSSKVLKTDVRIIAATNKDLLKAIKKNTFREDLYYRLNTVPIHVPALRERPEDINLLFRKFAGDFSEKYHSRLIQLDPEAQQLLKRYPWSGNVRELKNIAEQISVLAKEPEISEKVLEGFLPKWDRGSRLPVLSGAPNYPSEVGADRGGSNSTSNTEREILYKLFFDLKKDMNEVKKILYDFMGGRPALPYPTSGAPYRDVPSERPASSHIVPNPDPYNPDETNSTFRIPPHQGDDVIKHEEVEESLSLVDREKEFIIRALRKHKGKRKDAALELGISERTLYRKIKEYDIDE